MSGRRIVIGDVHGYYRLLCELLELISPTIDDRIYFVGDLIDRGKHSPEVVELVINNKYDCVLGNHELMMVNVGNSFRNYWCTKTRDRYKYKHSDLLEKHLHWMRQLPLYIDLDDYFVVHAGLDPKLSLSEQTADSCCWIREPFHFSTTPYFSDKFVVVGHTITSTFPDVEKGSLICGKNWLGIDTSPYASGWLTAIDVDLSMTYQVNTNGTSRIVDIEYLMYDVTE